MKNPFRAALIIIFLMLGGLAASAQTKTPVGTIEVVDGARTNVLTLEILAGLPQVEQVVTYQLSKGPYTARYKGPLLWDALKASKMFDGWKPGEELTKSLLVTASDDYKIVFSLGELAPEYGKATILLAIETDGKSLEKGFQIVPQGDRRMDRAIHDIVKIEIR